MLAELAHHAGVRASEVAGYDVVVADTQAPRVFGAHDAFLASGRLDNLLSVHAGLVALLEVAGTPGRPVESATIPVLAAFDHEEIGSESRSGASGPFLADVLDRVAAGLGATAEERHRQLAASLCVSSDVGHPSTRTTPSGTTREPSLAGGGPILKINANQRYTTDAHGAAAWARACARAGVPSQEFVSKNTVPCGSTIGPLTATRLGIRTVDVGVPILDALRARAHRRRGPVVPVPRGARDLPRLRSGTTPPAEQAVPARPGRGRTTTAWSGNSDRLVVAVRGARRGRGRRAASSAS